MINLEVPEAFAIDYISILKVKCNKDYDNETKLKQFNKCSDNLIKQLGFDFWHKIYNSKEYVKLYKTNEHMYDAVEKVRHGAAEIHPKEWDNLNMERHKAKQELQRVWFNKELEETKT